jgi:membrane protein YqaA with SNARE-associated domain
MFADFLQGSGVVGLFLVSFFEASFFPLPPEVLLLPMAVVNPPMAIFYAAVVTAGSTAGGMFGYFLGLKAGRKLLLRFVSRQKLSRVEQLFASYGGWAVAVAGFTPLPYKVFTIASGVFRIRKRVFLTASVLSRGARFLLEALLINAFGEQAIDFIKTYFGPLTIGLMAVVLFYAAWRSRRGS